MSVVALCCAVTLTASSQVPAGLGLSAARFRRGADSSLVRVFCRVPAIQLEALPGGMGAAFTIRFTVTSSRGDTLARVRRARAVGSAVLADPAGAVVEELPLTTGGGPLAVDVVVSDSASGRTLRADTALGAVAPVSGLVLGGGAWPVVAGRRGAVSYYFEAPANAGRASLWLVDSTGAARRLGVTPVPGTAAMAALPDLATGVYRLRLVVDTARRDAAFVVNDRAARAAGVAPADRFTTASEAQLDSLYAPLVLLMESDERGVYPSLTVEAKRDWLRRFWDSRDPTPGTPTNEAEDDFYAAIALANRRFRESGTASVPGWRTDRGRIFLRYGEPDEVLARPLPSFTQPYEVWKYTRGKPRKYCFMDLTGFGNYSLIYTDDITEPSRPNWRELLGGEAWDEVLRF